MGFRDPRVDAYIAKAAPFAQPILRHLRGLVHRGCPEIEETLKWGFPHFERDGIVCSMASFKAHCAFGFWNGELLGATGKETEAMGQFGRIAALTDLPGDRTIVRLVKRSVALNAGGVKKARPAAGTKPPIPLPREFRSALARNKAARATFENSAPSHRREYLEWITEAKTEPTRARRITTAIEWLSEGKLRNWKYEK